MAEIIKETYLELVDEDLGIENRVPALLRCDCGNRLYLVDALTNYCSCCGRAYNMCGQSIIPDPSQWEERWEDDY